MSRHLSMPLKEMPCSSWEGGVGATVDFKALHGDWGEEQETQVLIHIPTLLPPC